jgi:hypothetical protein
MEKQDFNTRSMKSTINYFLWTAAWVLSMALAALGPKFFWESESTLTVIGIALNTLIGIGWILAGVRFISGLDDLQRKIQLEASGIALGVGIVGGLSYDLLDDHVLSQDAEISHLVILISLTYSVAVFIGQKRYQ